MAAYDVLGDPVKRKKYDEDGCMESMMPEEHPDPPGTLMGFMKVAVHACWCWLPVYVIVKPVPCQELHLMQNSIRKAKEILFSREEVVREKLNCAFFLWARCEVFCDLNTQ